MGKGPANRNGGAPLAIPAESPLGQGIIAAARLLERDFLAWQAQAMMAAYGANLEIGNAPEARKARAFYSAFVSCRSGLAALLAEGYRRYIKLALAHAAALKADPAALARVWLEPAIAAGIGELRQWTVLACDWENDRVRPIATVAAQPGETVSVSIPTALPPAPSLSAWRAPGWLFVHYAPISGIGPLKTKNVPSTDGERLGAAQTRLILGGGRRLFLAELGSSVGRVRDEELAAAGAAPASVAAAPPLRKPNRRSGWERREKLLAAIRDVLSQSPGLEGEAFCAELDKRHAPPLPAWEESGERDGRTFKAAWKRPALRKKIRRVRQQAQRAGHAD